MLIAPCTILAQSLYTIVSLAHSTLDMAYFYLILLQDRCKGYLIVADTYCITGICGVVPRTFQLLLCALTELDKLADAVTTIHIETNRIDACMGSMEHVRLLLEGLTLIQGVMRMHSTGESRAEISGSVSEIHYFIYGERKHLL